VHRPASPPLPMTAGEAHNLAALRQEQRGSVVEMLTLAINVNVPQDSNRWHLRASRLLFALPVAAVVVWLMAAGAGADRDTVWEPRQRLLGALALICLAATSAAPKRIALGLCIVDLALVLMWMFAVFAQGLS
jgi:hypothetical protein